MATIVGDDSGSRLFWELVDTGLAEYASIGAYEFQGSGIVMNYLCCAPGDATDNLQRMRDVLRTIESDGVKESELELAKSKICSNVVRQSERSVNRLFSVGNGWVQRREYRTVKEAIAAYQSVTLPAIQAVIETYPLTVGTTVAVGPSSEITPPS